MTFLEALKKQCESGKQRRLKSRRILKLIESPESPERTFRLERLEAHAREQLVTVGAVESTEAIDWENIDWAKFFDGLLKFLLAIFAMFPK